MSQKTLLNLDNYLKQKKLLVYPYVIMKLLTDFNRLQTQKMIQEKAKKNIINIENCIHCQARKKKYKNNQHKNLLCQKHTAIYDWKTKNRNKFVIIKYNDRVFQCFSEYVLTQMTTDPNGVFVLWFSDIHRVKEAVFGLTKTFFPKIFEIGFDITEDIFQYKYLLYNDWIVNLELNNPTIEKVNE